MRENIFLFVCFVALSKGAFVSKEQCPPNEEYSPCSSACPTSCATIDQPELCSQQCVEGCFCVEGLVRNDNGTCIPVDDCPDQSKCPPDEVHMTCGPACQRTCLDLDKVTCAAVCVEGCFCPRDLVRHENGSCIPLSACSQDANVCGPNEEFLSCGAACPLTCTQPEPLVCGLPCSKGCFCKAGYVRDTVSNQCVTLDKCPVEQCLNENEVYDICNAACEPSCEDQEPICVGICTGGCICSPGLLRNATGDCVTADKCGNVTEKAPLDKYISAFNNIFHTRFQV